MSTSYGFFNSKNMDRVYTAEDFNEYLSGLICNGIFDNYGESFKVTPTGDLTITVGTGKAWIDGHYFISDTPFVLDLSSYVQAASDTYVLIGISCDTAENARMCKFEVSSDADIGTEEHPMFVDTETKKFLSLAEIRLSAGAVSVNQSDITDYRADESKCGYVKCILGKCHVSEILEKLDDYNKTVTELNQQISELQNRLTEVEEVTGSTGVVLKSAGQCGENVFYALYSNGSLKLTGSGSTYSYSERSSSKFYQRQDITSISVTSGVTKIGNNMFPECSNLADVTLPNTVTEIGEYAFVGGSLSIIGGDYRYGVKNINIPDSVKIVGAHAFEVTRLTEITIPASVETIGKYAFHGCESLENARIESPLMGDYMFTRCGNLSKLTIAVNCKTFGANMLTYCRSLEAINYEGTIAQWNSITKPANWICSADAGEYPSGYLKRILCTNGVLIWNTETSMWEEEVQ